MRLRSRGRLVLVLAAPVLVACGVTPDAGAAARTPTTSTAPAASASSAAPSTSAAATTPDAAPSSSPADVASPPARPAPASPPALSSTSCVDKTLAGMSPAARAGQLLLVGVDAKKPSAASAQLVALGVGGIFLHGRVAGTSTLRSVLATAQRQARAKRTPPLFVAVDEEGGLVQTVTGGTVPAFPSALAQGAWSTAKLRQTTAGWAAALAKLGVNLDLAPVADTVPASLGTSNPPIGRYRREYATTTAGVGRAVTVVVPALQRAHVGATVKHFPGLGRVRANTDTSAAAVDAVTSPTDPYLQPFRAGIGAGAVAVMVSSARYPKLDAKRPAMWSSAVVTGLLRGRLKWQGLVVSDDLGQAVAAKSRTPGARATGFVAAGGDLVLTVVPSQASAMRSALVALAASRAAWRHRVDDAVRHVLAAKVALGILRC